MAYEREAQENELQRALGDYQEKYDSIAASLEEHKQRSAAAEVSSRMRLGMYWRCLADQGLINQGKLADYKDAAERNTALEKEVKEKNLLVGKLRHEGESFVRWLISTSAYMPLDVPRLQPSS